MCGNDSIYRDLIGRGLKPGDWVVRAYNVGRCAELKFSYILNTNKGLRVVSSTERWEKSGYQEPQQGTMKYSDKAFLVEPHLVPGQCRVIVEDYVAELAKQKLNKIQETKT